MRINALVATLAAFGVSAQSANKFEIPMLSFDQHCRDVADIYLLTQRQRGGLTYPFCHDIAKLYHDDPNEKNKDQYFFNCFCMNEPWAKSYTNCLTNIGQLRNNLFKTKTDQVATDRCLACYNEYPPDSPYQYPKIYECDT